MTLSVKAAGQLISHIINALSRTRENGSRGRGMASLLLCLGLGAMPQTAMAAKCLFVSSYHHGYAWSDGVERGLRATLDGRCELKQFDMDVKRHKGEAHAELKALEAKVLIESWQPDVVITADDHAAKYLIKPFYKDHKIPFVFCGVNWTVEEYGFPYQNVTGMIEVAPIEPLLDQAGAYAQAPQIAFYLGADTLTERKNLNRFQQAAARRGLKLEHRLVSTTEAWLTAYEAAQRADFVILGSNSGINDWDRERIQQQLKHLASRMTLTNHEWMMPYTMLGLTKVPEEHGEWAAQTALLIMHGAPPASLPIVPNRMWDIWVNPTLLQSANIRLPKALMQKGKKVY